MALDLTDVDLTSETVRTQRLVLREYAWEAAVRRYGELFARVMR